MAKELASGIPSTRCVVGGFSQGGAVALLMLRSKTKLAAIVGERACEARRLSVKAPSCSLLNSSTRRSRHARAAHMAGLSTYLPLAGEAEVLSAENKSTPVLMCHGDADNVVRTARWRHGPGHGDAHRALARTHRKRSLFVLACRWRTSLAGLRTAS